VVDERDHSALGGDADAIRARLAEAFRPGLELVEAVRLGAAALGGPERRIPIGDLEVAVLERGDHRRCFRRIEAVELEAMLTAEAGASETATPEPADSAPDLSPPDGDAEPS
jgi:proteasome alpha subunit